MVRPALRPYLALLLLLCLVRTLLPEALVLALHAHTHTTEVAAPRRATSHPLLSAQHTHCHAEQFYGVPFELGLPLALPHPHQRARYLGLATLAPLASRAGTTRGPALRGPPRA